MRIFLLTRSLLTCRRAAKRHNGFHAFWLLISIQLVSSVSLASEPEPQLWLHSAEGDQRRVDPATPLRLLANQAMQLRIDAGADETLDCELLGAEGNDRIALDCSRINLLGLDSGAYLLQVRAQAAQAADRPARRWSWLIQGPNRNLLHLNWLLALTVAVSGVAVWMRRRTHLLLADTSALDKLVKQRLAQLEATNQRLRTLSETDGLTGLSNRRHFDEVLREQLARALLIDRPLAVLMLDVDHFKAYNDANGHLAGDDILRRIGAELRGSIRNDTLAARYGGEEFALIAPARGKEAQDLAERLRRRIESQIGVTASFGVACFDVRRDADEAALIARADGALYQAKRAGRNRVHTDSGEFTSALDAEPLVEPQEQSNAFEGEPCPNPPQIETWPEDELADSAPSATGNSTSDTLASSGSDRTLKPS
jgi:diguanylate cyclase (GGDEF)-like protein